jgi:Uma2 family endonuclease
VEYFGLNTNRLVELSDGRLEVLPPPSTSHQFLLGNLYGVLHAFGSARGLGKALIAALPVRLWPGKIREPDVVFLLAEQADRMGEQFGDGADLVVEVVSDDRRRDLEIKRDEYARAGIAEYWIVDPLLARVTVLRLDGDLYAAHGEYARGEQATSPLLPGLAVDVAAALDAR